MDATKFEQFIAEALTTERETDTVLGPDELYGLYTSWCLIHKLQPAAPTRCLRLSSRAASIRRTASWP
jgi:hypothetical protein